MSVWSFGSLEFEGTSNLNMEVCKLTVPRLFEPQRLDIRRCWGLRALKQHGSGTLKPPFGGATWMLRAEVTMWAERFWLGEPPNDLPLPPDIRLSDVQWQVLETSCGREYLFLQQSYGASGIIPPATAQCRPIAFMLHYFTGQPVPHMQQCKAPCEERGGVDPQRCTCVKH